MKKISLLLSFALLALTSVNAFAMPDPLDVEFRLNHGDSMGSAHVLGGYQMVSNKVQLLKCIYDVKVSGGSSTAAIYLRMVDGSFCTAPQNALILDGIIDVLTAPLSAGNASIGIGVAGSTQNILLPLAKASWTLNSRLDTIPVSTAATAIKVTGALGSIANRVTANVSSATVGPLTTGKFNVFLEYVMSN